MSSSPKPNTPAVYPPSKTALLLLDYHNHIVNMIQPPEEQAKLVSSVRDLISAARQNSAPIVHCLINFGAEPAQTSKVKEHWETSYKPLLSSTPEPAEERADFLPSAHPAGAPEKETTVLKVPGCISAMKSEDILPLLKDKYKVESLVICGLITSGAVLSTAREAADLGFVTTVVQDGCWDYNPDSHTVIMNKVLPMTVWVVGLQEGLDLLGGAGESS
ncbi:putative isochorismatase family protein YecD [Tolypocladium ophioglossoides CBS 100239]|uniref:Putative isochorismatase family protein YecD n=1 Tax=Tolypocladium ophioglossoides (strain CBS 100239) TaxID=1163406 RepID=A0A0L0MZ18_TOLOC|nr:putative isochorismatase family protein YecD [Tolypocladium ophioglossoides CBS 100239]